MTGAITGCAQDKRIAYVLLWFPLASETFIFREIQSLRKQGLFIDVFTLYGKSLRGCSQAMLDYAGPVHRMGSIKTFAILGAFLRALWRKPRQVCALARRGLFRRMRNLESLAENVWCFFGGFLLAEKCADAHISLIHAAWANGPATAAWVASQMTGIPFAFSGRAGDIYPQDGILAEKARDAAFIRVNNAANLSWLSSFCPPGEQDKVKLVYNNLVFAPTPEKERNIPDAPYKILSVGRLVRTKGFPELFTAIARLRRENFPVRLTLVGDGAWKRKLLELRKQLNLEDLIDMPGFVPNDQIARLMREHDLLAVPSVVHSNGDRDGIPNVIMEALSQGMPVVATDVCGISEVIRDGQTGLLTPQRDPAALARAIRRICSDWSDSLLMARKGGELVREMFNPQKNTEALCRIYADALAAPQNPCGVDSGC